MRRAMRSNAASLAVWTVMCSTGLCAAESLVEEDYTFTSSLDATGPLYAKAVYRKSAKGDPIMVVQHGYGGRRQSVVYSARRMVSRSYFCLCIDTRGCGGSAGTQDDGGLEIMDIRDGILAGVKKYGDKLDPSRVSIIGYSNGGANVYFATVRFPYLFGASMAMFGITDYAMWIGLHPPKFGFRKHVVKAVGGEPADVPDKYMARNTCLAAGNLSGTRFHIVYDEQERLCPIPMNTAFVNASHKAGYKNLFLHVSKKTDKHRWRHGYNTRGHLSPIEDVFMDDIDKSQPETPTMPAAGELVVLGFLVTPRFTCVLGHGDDAVARIAFRFAPGKAELKLSKPMTSNKDVRAKITLPAGLFEGDVLVGVNDGKPATFPGAKTIELTAPAGATITIQQKH